MGLFDSILPPKLKRARRDSLMLKDWRHWLGGVLAWAFLLLLPLFAITAFPIFIAKQHYILAGLYVFLWLLLAARIAFAGNKLLASRYLWLALLYFIGVSAFYVLGPGYARSAWLVFGSVLAAIYFSPRAVLLTSFSYVLILMAMYWTVGPDHAAWAPAHESGLKNWLFYVAGVCLLSFGAGLPVAYLLERLDKALAREKAVNQDITQERIQLVRAHDDLKSEMRERALAQFALKESEEKLHLLTDSLPNAVIYQVLVEPDGTRRFTYVSKSVERLNELTVEEVLADGSKLYGQVAPEFLDGLKVKEEESLENLTTFSHTIKSILPSGRERWFDLASTPRRTASGALVYDGVQVDVTDREAARQALRDSERLYHALMTTSHDSIVILDDNYRFVWANEEFCHMIGYAHDEVMGMDFRDTLDQKTARGTVAHYQAKLRGENPPPRLEFVVVRKDGVKRWVEVNTSELESDDGRKRIVVQLLDITKRKEAEKALKESENLYRALVENSHAGISLLDDSYRLTYANDEHCKMLGYEREELQDLDFRETLAEETAQTVIDGYQAHLRGDYSPQRYEFMIKRKDGTKRWVETSVASIVDSKGRRFSVAQMLDINERKEAEKALKESEEMFRVLVENSHDGISLLDDSFHITYANDEYCNIVGYDYNELLGRDFRDILAEETAHMVTDYYLARQRGENPPQRYEFKIKRKDGTKRWVEVISSRIMDSEGKKYTVAQMLDITERKEAHEAIKASESLYRALVEHSHAGIVQINDKFQLSYVNDEFCRLLGYAREEILGRDFRELLSPETAHMVVERYLARQHGEAPPSRYEFLFVRKDGQKRWGEISAATTKDSKGKTFAVAQLLDVTERQKAEKALKESEEKFRQVIQASPMGVHMYELREPGRLVLTGANPAADRILGIEHAALIGMDMEQAFPSLAETDTPRKYRDAATKEEPWFKELLKYEDENISGAYEVYAFQTAPGMLTVMFQDITERKKAEQEKARLESQLRQSQKMEAIGTLTGGIAHDFNNILGAILGMAEISLLKGNSFKTLSNNMGSIRDMSIRGRDLVHRLLAFSRQEEQAVRTLDLAEVVTECLGMLKSTLPANVELHKELAPGLLVTADPIQIQQVVLNLCTNAVQAMEDVGGRLTVRVGPSDLGPEEAKLRPGLQAGPHALLEVSDSGHGIPTEMQERIFDPFFTTKPMGRGTGLGLSLAHGIIRSHHGYISVSSREGAGTTLSVLLPLAHLEHDAQAEPETASPMEGRGEHILVVDDEEIISRSTAQILEALGYRVSCFTAAQDAAEAFKQNPDSFDLILTDHVMPGLTGRQLAEMAGELRPGLPVVMMTGMPDGVEQEEGTGPVAMILTKPVTINEVGEAIRQVLDQLGAA